MPEHVNGHIFNFDPEICARCGLGREAVRDMGDPRCSGRRADAEPSASSSVEPGREWKMRDG
jgi:hypothetical protein